MLKQTLMAASLALLLAGPALAGDPGKRDEDSVAGMVNRVNSKDAPAKPDKNRKKDEHQASVQNLERMPMPVRDKRDNLPREVNLRRDELRDRRETPRDVPDRVWRAVDHRDNDWRDRDWRRDDDWRRRGWVYNGWRNDGWRYYRFNDNRHWRYCPPYRYSFDNGYRSGYELAWRDWLNYGRYNRYWQRNAFFGYGGGSPYRSGYDAGWRDAAIYYDRGYRPDYWGYDPQGGWYFSFRIG